MGDSTKAFKPESQSASSPESKKRSIAQLDGEIEQKENIITTKDISNNEESPKENKRSKVDYIDDSKTSSSMLDEISENKPKEATITESLKTVETKTKTKTETETETETETDIKPSSTTETESKTVKEAPANPAKPAFVFGSSTSFGSTSAFGSIGVKSVFGGSTTSSPIVTKNDTTTPVKTENNNKELIKETKTEPEVKKSIFGSSSTFGSGFTAPKLNTKSIFDNSNEKLKTDKNSESIENDAKDGKNKEVYQKVHLEKQQVKSGEENEVTLFQVKAKLYHMDLKQVSDGWKERGVGILKLNKFVKPESENYNARLVMRQDGILKLILNVPIIKDFKVYKGMASSLSSDKFVRFQGVENGDLVQYALKIGQVENASILFNQIEEYIPK